MKAISLLILIFLFGCTKLKEKPKALSEEVTNLEVSNYQLDGKGGLFNNINWYAYDFQSHRIIPKFDVFALKKTNGEKTVFYKLQIFGYYDGEEAGNYSLRVAESDGITREVELNASACGNAFQNPNFGQCNQDPEKNAFTYLSFDTLETWKMSDTEALANSKWDLAFKRTEIKMNAGTSGPGQIVGALGSRNPNWFDENGEADIDTLWSVGRTDEPLGQFNKFTDIALASFFPPDGIDEVIHHSMWYEEAEGLRSAITDNWWIIRSAEGKSYARFQVSGIRENTMDSVIRSDLTFAYYLQSEGQSGFSEGVREVQIPSFSSEEPIVRHCIDFDSRALFVECAGAEADLKLLIANKKSGRTWKIMTVNGAYGPLNRSQALGIAGGD